MPRRSSVLRQMRCHLFLLVIAACDAGGTPCMGDLDALCARRDIHCEKSFAAAADASTWCGAREVTHARVSTNDCAGLRVLVATQNDASVWYYYDQDGGLVGAGTRGDDFKPRCLAGNFRLPEDCASSTNKNCCRFDFSKDLACTDSGAD